MKPKYGEIIIGAIKNKGILKWYVAELEFWIMDLKKRNKEFEDKGYVCPHKELVEARFGVEVLDFDNRDLFLKGMEDYCSSVDELRQLTKECPAGEAILELTPAILIDFDQKVYYSCFQEILPFEKYVPQGWAGEYRDFTEVISESLKYWVVDGRDLIRGKYTNK